MLQLMNWHEYLNPANNTVELNKEKSRNTFSGQRTNIKKLCKKITPKTVLCLGSGYLNDIPTEDFLENGCDLYFADWLQDITKESFNKDLVRKLEESFACLACLHSSNPQKYCKNHKAWPTKLWSQKQKPKNYCANFELIEEVTPICGNYKAGDFPQFYETDVTAGIAHDFVENVAHILDNAHKPRQALRKAIKKSQTLSGHTPIPLKDHSLDLITTSMVISQFDFEPYTYFIDSTVKKFGKAEIDKDINVIKHLDIQLRNDLYLAQAEGHCREILRLLKPEGHVYFSIETLHREKENTPWFQLEIIPKTMELIGQYFFFDLDTMPEVLNLERVDMPQQGNSVIQSHILVPKPQ